MWKSLQRPASWPRRRIYEDGKPHAIAEAWRRWGWLTGRIAAGLVATGLVGIVCAVVARGPVLRSIGFLLMLAPVALVAMAPVGAIIALVVALARRLGRTPGMGRSGHE